MGFLSTIKTTGKRHGGMPMGGMAGVGASQNAALLFQQQQQQKLQLQRLQQQEQLRQEQESIAKKPEPGSLIIQDGFRPSPELTAEERAKTGTKSPHGDIVAHSATYDGFQGPVVERQLSGSPGYNVKGHELGRLQSGKLDQNQALSAIRGVIEGGAAGVLQQQSVMLDHSTAQGAKNTVTNISQGTSKGRMTEELYFLPDKMLGGGSAQDKAKAKATMRSNYATAFGLDENKLYSADPKINGPERQKLQQSLADLSSDVIDNSPRIAGAKKQFEASVQRYEAGNNSVVISAGNEGDAKSDLRKSNNGLSINTPADFDANVLQNDQVTSVGATRWFNNDGKLTEKRAGYSSESGGADIYASGSVDFNGNQQSQTQGTSYAAPRVAATMAQLHKDYPDMSSSQIESLMKQSLTHDLNTSSGSVKVLDYGKSFEYLKNGTF